MVKVTVIQCTRRKEPHFEWALKSLQEQTYKDFEYIIIDGLYEQRKDEVNKLIKEINTSFPILYLKDKLSRWKNVRPSLCNARNTGLIFAKGEYIVFHDDNCRLQKNWLEKHIKWLEQNYIVAGNWLSYQSTDQNGNGVIGCFGWEHRSAICKEAKTINGGWLYGGNFSLPLKSAIDINGFDELYDGEMGQDDIDFGIRAERKDYKIMYDPSCYLEYFYDTHGILMGYVTEKQKIIELNVIPVNIMLKDGKYHFSNEFLMQELLYDTKRYLPRGNNFNLNELRKMVIEKNYNVNEIYKMLENYVDKNLHDWRDGKLVSEKIKEKI